MSTLLIIGCFKVIPSYPSSYIPNAPKWNNDPMPYTSGHVQLSPYTTNQVGDKLIYFNVVNGVVSPTHSAIVTGVNTYGEVTQVKRKWGELGVYVHHLWDVSSDYQSTTDIYGNDQTRAYFRPY